MDAVPGQDVKAVDVGQIHQGLYVPLALALAGHHHDAGFLGIVGGIKLVGRQELAVMAGHLDHGHDAAGFIPHLIHLIAFQVEKQAGIVFFRRHQDPFLAAHRQGGDGVAFRQIRYFLLRYFHDSSCIFSSFHAVIS